MSDVKFELNYMHTVYKNFNEAKSDLDTSVDDFVKVCQKAEGESSSFINEGRKACNDVVDYIHQINDDIRVIQGKRRNAMGQKKDEIPLPNPPSIPKDASPEAKANIIQKYNETVYFIKKQNEKIRENNNKIDEYIKKCDKAIKDLETLISRLNKINDSIKKTMSSTNNQVKDFLNVKNSFINDGKIICSVASEFSKVFYETIDIATRIEMFEEYKFSSQNMIDRQFVIKNNHSRSSNGFAFDFSGLDFAQTETKEESKEKIANDEEILVKDRDEESFFANIQGVNKFKMPSSNLHRLGGKKFISKMQSVGFELIVLDNGSTIDNNGMLHWERKR
jgi:hypothetical protein